MKNVHTDHCSHLNFRQYRISMKRTKVSAISGREACIKFERYTAIINLPLACTTFRFNVNKTSGMMYQYRNFQGWEEAEDRQQAAVVMTTESCLHTNPVAMSQDHRFISNITTSSFSLTPLLISVTSLQR